VLLFIEPLAAALCASMSLFFMYQQKLMGSRLYKKFMLNSILKSSTFLVFPLLLFFIFEIPGILLGMIISNFVSSIPLYSTIKLKISFSGLQKYYKILIHNFAADVSGSLSLMIDKLLIASLFGFFIVGIYQFNTQILIALGTLPGILGSYLISEMAHGSNHKVISLLTFLLSVMITVVGIVTAPFFINTLFPGYSEGIFSLQILLITIIPQTIGTIFGSSLLAKGSTKLGFIAIIKIGSLLPLFVYFGNIFGLVGLSLAFLISIILSTLVTYFVYKYGGNDKIFDNNTLEDLP
jgi:O-antigen/teichoic acid export membrane protein